MVCLVTTYPLDSDLSCEERYPVFEQLGSGDQISMSTHYVVRQEREKLNKLSAVYITSYENLKFHNKTLR